MLYSRPHKRACFYLTCFCACAPVDQAWAEGASLDLEMVDPSFSSGAVPGIDSPIIRQAGDWRVGTLVQYQRDPLLLYWGDLVEGAVVAKRATAQLGFSYDWNPRFSSRVLLPMVLQWDGEVPSLDADGYGLRDLQIGVRFGLAEAGPITTALRADLYFPSGARTSWMGEDALRPSFGLLASVGRERAQILAELGFMGRHTLDTGLDFEATSEILGRLGGRLYVVPERWALTGGLLGRGGVAQLATGGGENAAEGWLGLQAGGKEGWLLDLGMGRGLTEGYGTSTLRLFAGLTWAHRSPTPEPEPRPVVATITRITTTTMPELIIEELEEEERPWEEGELARVEQMSITIREPINFEFATPNLLPESRPVLEAVAQLMAEYWQIDHLVIEGHASEEGSFTYNYDLSMDRARAVFDALVGLGVHPSRMSFRGMGEVRPASAGESEAALAANRRVVFKIQTLLHPLEPPPDYGEQMPLPWTGETVQVRHGTEKLIGAEDKEPVVGPTEGDAIDILQGYLKEERDGEAPTPEPAGPEGEPQ